MYVQKGVESCCTPFNIIVYDYHMITIFISYFCHRYAAFAAGESLDETAEVMRRRAAAPLG